MPPAWLFEPKFFLTKRFASWIAMVMHSAPNVSHSCGQAATEVEAADGAMGAMDPDAFDDLPCFEASCARSFQMGSTV